jgi:hypothetical protein
VIDPPPSARLRLPPWIWGGNPQAFLAECSYRARNASPHEPGEYRVQANESYLHQRPDLVRLSTIADAQGVRRYDDLGALTERVDPPMPDTLLEVLESRRIRAEAGGGLIDIILHQTLLLYALPIEKLPVQVGYLHETLREIPVAEDPTSRPFENSSVHLLEVKPWLLHRLKIASVWLRLKQDVRMGRGDLSPVKEMSRADSAFSSSVGLYSGIFMFDAYLGPLLAAGTPGVWALTVTRTFGTLIFGLGSFVSGTTGDASEFLQLISIPGAPAPVPFPKLSAPASSAALSWWGDRLNSLFGVLSDLAVFTDRSEWYVPAKHLEAMLTMEQIFRRTTSMLVAHRDVHGRRSLFFTLLDSLESVTGVDFLRMCSATYAQATLDRIQAGMPPECAEVLLPAAERGAAALKQMQDGFFIRRQLGTLNVELQLSAGDVKEMSPEEGVARYLKVLRDATHGHRSNKAAVVAITEALLAHHDGEVPHDVGLIAYLYLLDVLSSPERLRRVLYRSGK